MSQMSVNISQYQVGMEIINPLKWRFTWQITILQTPLIKPMSLSIQGKRIGNIRIAKMKQET